MSSEKVYDIISTIYEAVTKINKDIIKPEPPQNKQGDIDFLKRVFNVNSVSNELGASISSSLGSNFKDPKKITGFKHPEIKSIKALPAKEGSSSDFYELIVKANGRKIIFKDTTKVKGKDSRDVKSLTSDKELTPSKLGLAGKKYKRPELLSATKKAISGKDKIIKEIMNDLLDAVFEIKGRSKSFNVTISNFNKMIQGIANSDEANIMKDFGEIVSALAIADDNDTIFFPDASNQPLVDFIIAMSSGKNGKEIEESYSAKFNAGAKPSVTGIMSQINTNKTILKDEKGEKALYEVLKIIANNNYIKGIHELSSHLKVDDIAKNIKDTDGKKKGWNKNKVADEYSKYIACRDYLNKEKVLNGQTYADVLSELVNTISNINQAYLLYKSGDTVSFEVKNFKNEKFVFAFSNSSKKLQNKMAFQMK